MDAISDFSGVEFRPVLEGLEVTFVDFEGVNVHPECGEVVGVEPLIRADVEDQSPLLALEEFLDEGEVTLVGGNVVLDLFGVVGSDFEGGSHAIGSDAGTDFAV